MDLRITHNIREMERALSDAARQQIPYATSLAINETLEDVKKNSDKNLARRLDRPTPFTLRAFRIRRSSKRSLVGSVFAMDRQAAYLKYAETGGTRRPKGRALLVPVGQRVNKYGNLPRGSIARTLAKPNTFSGAPGGRAGGIYQRVGKGKRQRLKLLAHYAPSATYRKRLGFKDGARKTAIARLPRNFERAFIRAFASRF